MTENPAASEWSAARGDKWRAQLTGMEAMIAPVDEPLLSALQLDAPYAIAEVGCGGGGTAKQLVKRAPQGSVVHGYDISASLIEVARARVTPHEPGLAFEVADVASAAPAKPYDRLLSRFGIMFFDEPRSAFANLARWLKPGGRFAFAAWGNQADNPWLSRVREVVASIVPLQPTDPDAPGPYRYADANKLLSVLGQSGFGQLAVHDWCGPLPIGGQLSPAEAARFALSAFSGFGEQLAQAGDAAIEEARRGVTTVCEKYQRDGAVWMEASVHLFTGTRS